METTPCECGLAATHRCFACKPPVHLCLLCVETHLSQKPEDSLISLKRFREEIDTSSVCQNCREAGSVFLDISDSQVKPICRKCKKLLKTEDSIIIPVKWKEIVTDYKKLSELCYRIQISKQAYEEIEASYSGSLTDSYLNGVKDSLTSAISKMIQKKKEENKVKAQNNIDIIKKLKAEIDCQVAKKHPDSDTEAGKLVVSLMNSKLPRTCPRLKCFNPTLGMLNKIENIIDKMLFKQETSYYNLFLFHPGRPAVSKIDLEKLVRKELVFDRNWNFEASWCELESREILFCGGNGLNSSDVLIVNPETLNISCKKSFTGRAGHSMQEIDREIYVFGGNRGKIAEKLSIDSDEWHSLADLPYKITRASTCVNESSILVVGIDCINIYSYNIKENSYLDLGNSLEAFRTKNKILFTHGDFVYCMSGNKVFFSKLNSFGEWESSDIIDRDWWSYCKPVVYNDCAYFVKYFVRNLWKLNLKTFELTEILINDLELET